MAIYNKPTSTLIRGNMGPDVGWVQMAVNSCGVPCDVDEKFGPLTEEALKIFQCVYGLASCGCGDKPDGIVGPKTRNRLDGLLNGAHVEKMVCWAAYMANALVVEKWHYKSGSFSNYKTFEDARKGAKTASCAAYVSWIAQKADLLAAGKEISHTAAGVGTGAKAIKYAQNLRHCKITYPNALAKQCHLNVGDIVIFDSNICIYAGNLTFFDAGGPFSANCDKKDGNKYIKIPSQPAYDMKHRVLAVIRAIS